MNGSVRLQRLSGWSAIVACVLQIGVIVTAMSGYRDFSAAMADPGAISNLASPTMLRWSMIFDFLGYYLLMTPAVLALAVWLQPKSPDFVRLYTVCGLFYVLIGAIGAGLMAVVGPNLVVAYEQANATRKEIIDVVYRTMWTGVQSGLWMMLEAIPAGVWFLGTGLLLRSERAIFGIATVVLGGLTLLSAFGAIVNIEVLGPSGIGLLWGLLFPFWTLWLGVILVREPAKEAVA